MLDFEERYRHRHDDAVLVGVTPVLEEPVVEGPHHRVARLEVVAAEGALPAGANGVQYRDLDVLDVHQSQTGVLHLERRSHGVVTLDQLLATELIEGAHRVQLVEHRTRDGYPSLHLGQGTQIDSPVTSFGLRVDAEGTSVVFNFLLYVLVHEHAWLTRKPSPLDHLPAAGTG